MAPSDSTTIHVIKAILSCLTRNDLQNDLGANWSESEIVVDWLISKYFKKFDPNGTRKQASDNYIASLGAPITIPNTLQKIDPSTFPPAQQIIFKLLLDKSPQIITNDEIIDHLYPNNPGKFSLYAIAKQIQRLRDRLEKFCTKASRQTLPLSKKITPSSSNFLRCSPAPPKA